MSKKKRIHAHTHTNSASHETGANEIHPKKNIKDEVNGC